VYTERPCWCGREKHPLTLYCTVCTHGVQVYRKPSSHNVVHKDSSSRARLVSLQPSPSHVSPQSFRLAGIVERARTHLVHPCAFYGIPMEATCAGLWIHWPPLIDLANKSAVLRFSPTVAYKIRVQGVCAFSRLQYFFGPSKRNPRRQTEHWKTWVSLRILGAEASCA
jgi:hypothetical protein